MAKKFYTNVDLVATPTEDTHVVNKGYVDNAISKKVKDPVRAVSTGDVDLSSVPDPLTIDGVSIGEGDRILLVGQTDPTQNGIYVYTADKELVRAEDMDSREDLLQNMMVPVSDGTNNGDTVWVLTNDSFDPSKDFDQTEFTFAKVKGDSFVSSYNGSFVGEGADAPNEFEIAHHLGTKNVQVQVFDEDGAECMFDIVVVDENNVKVCSDVSMQAEWGEFSVVVQGQKDPVDTTVAP